MASKQASKLTKKELYVLQIVIMRLKIGMW